MLSIAIITICETFQPASRFFTGASVKNKVASLAPVSCSAWKVARIASWYPLSPRSCSLPSPTSNTRSHNVSGTLCNTSVEPALPFISPPRNMPLIYPLAVSSMACAASVSLRDSNTPTTMQALRCFSGFPFFMLNFTPCSLILGFVGGLQSRIMGDYRRTVRIKSKQTE